MTRRLTLTPVPLTARDLDALGDASRQGSSPPAEPGSLVPSDARVASGADARVLGRHPERPKREPGSGMSLACPNALTVMPLPVGGRILEPDRPGGWNTDYPDLPGRGAQDGTELPYSPAVMLRIERSRCQDRYRLHVTLTTRDDKSAAAIHDHWICAVVTYLDRETRKAWEAHDSKLAAEHGQHWRQVNWLNSGSITDAMFASAWTGIKRWYHDSYRDHGLEVTVNDLLGDGLSIYSDDFDDIREVERSILMSVDAINMGVEIGLSFDRGEIADYAPGSKQKPRRERDGTDDTPPGDWEA